MITQTYEEKQTDSWIASLMVADALADRGDIFILLAGDSDHIPPVRTILKERPEKRVVIGWPPHRRSNDLGKAASASFSVSDQLIRSSQFPETVLLPNGDRVRRPPSWS